MATSICPRRPMLLVNDAMDEIAFYGPREFVQTTSGMPSGFLVTRERCAMQFGLCSAAGVIPLLSRRLSLMLSQLVALRTTRVPAVTVLE